MKKRRVLWILIMGLLLAGCQTAADIKTDTVKENQHIKLIVTQAFGQKTMFDEDVAIQKDATVWDALEANVELEAKGDGFVEGINGLQSDRGGMGKDRQDWFYYVNGVCADVGAMGYTLSPEDVVWWDYHLWKTMGSTHAAVVGAYPEPFVRGYAGVVNETVLVVAEGHEANADQLETSLVNQGVTQIQRMSLNDAKLMGRVGPTMVIGEWETLRSNAELVDLNEAYLKTGVNVHFVDGGVELLGVDGEMAEIVSGSCGVIVATGTGLGDENPLWIISGTDKSGVERAIELVIEEPRQLALKYGVAVKEEKVLALPIDKER